MMRKTNDWFFLKNVEHSIKREVMQSGKNYASCKLELEKNAASSISRIPSDR